MEGKEKENAKLHLPRVQDSMVQGAAGFFFRGKWNALGSSRGGYSGPLVIL